MAPDREPDPEIAAELRQTAGWELLEETAEDERLTELQRRRRLTIHDEIRELTHRRARVAVELGGHSFSGPLMWAGADYATLRAPGQDVDVRLFASAWEVLTSKTDVEGYVDGPDTFEMHLHQLAGGDDRVGLVTHNRDLPVGRIEVVATDHIEFVGPDGRRLLVPKDQVLATIRTTASH